MKRFVQIILVLVIAGLVGAGLFFNQQQNPDSSPVPDEVLAPLLEIQAMLDEQQPNLNEDVKTLIEDIRERFYALDDSPSIDPDAKKLEETATDPMAKSNYFSDPNAAFDGINSQIGDAMNELMANNAGDLAERMDEVFKRVKQSVDKTQSGVKDAIDGGAKIIEVEPDNDDSGATN